MSEVKKHIQIIGEPGSGKTEISGYLQQEYGYRIISISEIIKRYAFSRGIKSTREGLFIAHQRYLEENGEFSIPKDVLSMADGYDRVCIDGLRVVAHAFMLRELGFNIVALDCDPGIRRVRVNLRKLRQPSESWNHAMRGVEEPMYGHGLFVPNTRAVMDMAEVHVDTSQSLLSVRSEMLGVLGIG